MTTIIIQTLISIVFLVGAIIQYLKNNKLSKTGVQVKGIVYEFEMSENVAYPIIRFNTKENESITKTHSISLLPGTYKKGSAVTVIYDPNKPTSFIIKSFYQALVPILFGIIGVILLGMAIYGLVSNES